MHSCNEPTIVATSIWRLGEISVISNRFARDLDVHFTDSIDAGPARATRSPYLYFRISKLNLQKNLPGLFDHYGDNDSQYRGSYFVFST